MQKTKYQIALVPTEDIVVGQIYKSGDEIRIADELDVQTIKKFKKEGWPSNAWIPQHIYVLSSVLPVKPKKGQFFLFWGSNGTDLFKYRDDAGYGIRGKDVNTGLKMLYATSRCSNVVLASTDKRLNLPSVPKSFIERYIFKQGITFVTITGELKSTITDQLEMNGNYNKTYSYEKL